MNHDFINKCVKLSELHILRFLKRNKDDCGDFESNPFDSLRYFLWEYAFERQGSSRDYAAVAREVILEASEKEKDFSLGAKIPVKHITLFSSLITQQGPVYSVLEEFPLSEAC